MPLWLLARIRALISAGTTNRGAFYRPQKSLWSQFGSQYVPGNLPGSEMTLITTQGQLKKERRCLYNCLRRLYPVVIIQTNHV